MQGPCKRCGAKFTTTQDLVDASGCIKRGSQGKFHVNGYTSPNPSAFSGRYGESPTTKDLVPSVVFPFHISSDSLAKS